jgi:hypothetical protein
MTNEELPHTNLTPNWALRSAALEWREAASAATRPTPLTSRPTPYATTTPTPANYPTPAGAPAHPATNPTPAAGSQPTLGPTARLTAALSGRHRAQRVGGSAAGEHPLPLPDWALDGEAAVRDGSDVLEGEATEAGLVVGDDVRVSDDGEAMEQDWEGERAREGNSPRVVVFGVEGEDDPARAPEGLVGGVGRDGGFEGQEVLEGGDVVMADVEFEGGEGDEELWPEVPTHRITRTDSQRERILALA